MWETILCQECGFRYSTTGSKWLRSGVGIGFCSAPTWWCIFSNQLTNRRNHGSISPRPPTQIWSALTNHPDRFHSFITGFIRFITFFCHTFTSSTPHLAFESASPFLASRLSPGEQKNLWLQHPVLHPRLSLQPFNNRTLISPTTSGGGPKDGPYHGPSPAWQGHQFQAHPNLQASPPWAVPRCHATAPLLRYQASHGHVNHHPLAPYKDGKNPNATESSEQHSNIQLFWSADWHPCRKGEQSLDPCQ